jgi:hypothetical protein
MKIDPSGRPARRALPSLLALSLLLAGTAGCTAARNLLGTRISPCFRVLPAAQSAVGERPNGGPEPIFIGIQWLSANSLVRAVKKVPGASAPPPAPLVNEHHRGVCAVAFRGAVSPSGSIEPWVPAPVAGKFAIAVVRQSDSRVLATVVLARLPPGLRFSKRYAFLH